MDNPFTTLIERMEERLKEHHDSIEKLLSIKEKPSAEHDEVLTRQQVADLFSVSIYTVSDWVKRGILKQYKVGNRSYFKHSELIEVLTKSNTADHEE